MEAHRKAVDTISNRVKSFWEQKTPFRLYHGSTNTTQQRKVDRAKVVDTSSLNHVFNIDKTSMTCLAEPNVAMDELVEALLPHGLLPPVVMEFPGITVGGGFAGTAGESSGFKEGFFDRTVNWIEIVLPTGEVVKASPTERKDIFHGAAGSFGTLGVSTLFEIRLIHARQYVELTYHPVRSVAEALQVMDVATQDSSNDYVDGIQFSNTHGVIITGRLVDKITNGAPIQRFSRAQDPWFYIHVERATRRNMQKIQFTTPVRDYLFRFDRGAFWTGKYAFKYFLVPFNRITRYILDYFLHTRVMYHALHESGHASKYIVQDLLLPRKGVEPFVEFIDNTFGFWPLWLCPLKRGEEVPLHPKLSDDLSLKEKSVAFVNVGAWGPGSTSYPRFVEQNRQLEHKVRELGGIKWLYAQAYYTEDEFWLIYDKKWYDALREKYHASYLPSVYQKVSVDLSKLDQKPATLAAQANDVFWRIWPMSGLYGVVKTLLHRDYLLAK